MAYETTDELVALLAHHWYKRPDGNIYKLFDIYNGGMEQISDAGDRVMKWRGIQDAQGTTLDLFGKDIQTYRPTKDDPPYRFLIYLKTLLARAQGTIPSIVKITGTALGTFDGIKIWKTKAPRHIGISLPYDYVSDWPIEKFLINNLQNMLALGYWLDIIVFYTKTETQGYLGAGTVDKTTDDVSNDSTWWTGWKSAANATPYLGVANTSADYTRCKTQAEWWSGWSDTEDVTVSIGSKLTSNESQDLDSDN